MSPEARAHRRAHRARYPRKWTAISRAVIARARFRCEACGAQQGQSNPITGSKVVLGTAHLDHQPENVAPDNLRAWCQRCHLAYDKPHHLAQRKANQRARVAPTPAGWLFPVPAVAAEEADQCGENGIARMQDLFGDYPAASI
jgi:5-methylcytosine-specific restriction endonuclease McrA